MLDNPGFNEAASHWASYSFIHSDQSNRHPRWCPPHMGIHVRICTPHSDWDELCCFSWVLFPRMNASQVEYSAGWEGEGWCRGVSAVGVRTYCWCCGYGGILQFASTKWWQWKATCSLYLFSLRLSSIFTPIFIQLFSRSAVASEPPNSINLLRHRGLSDRGYRSDSILGADPLFGNGGRGRGGTRGRE